MQHIVWVGPRHLDHRTLTFVRTLPVEIESSRGMLIVLRHRRLPAGNLISVLFNEDAAFGIQACSRSDPEHVRERAQDFFLQLGIPGPIIVQELTVYP